MMASSVSKVGQSTVPEHAEDIVEKTEPEASEWEPSPEAERKLRRKLDFTILPWIMMMYFLSYMDR